MKNLKIAYEFGDPSLFEQALTHRSAGGQHNERLEFLGDGVLNFIVAHALYQSDPSATEGDLSRQRARLVRKETLADVAREIELGESLRLGPGENRSGGYRRDSILADALEALVGAIYLDGGYDAAAAIVRRWFVPRIAALPDSEALKDAKTRLQEVLQSQGITLPTYQLVDARGPDHLRIFRVSCQVPELDLVTEGEDSSRRKAEQVAASEMLRQIDQAQ